MSYDYVTLFALYHYKKIGKMMVTKEQKKKEMSEGLEQGILFRQQVLWV